MAQFRTLAELASTTQDELLPGLYDITKKNDEFSGMLFADAVLTDRPAVEINRMLDKGAAEYVGCDDSITPVAISGSGYNFPLYTINRSFDACIKGQNLYSSFTDVVGAELEGAIKALAEKIGTEGMKGNGVSAISGLETQTTNSFAISGGDILGGLDRAYDETLSRGNLVFVGAPAAVRAIVAELRSTAGGLQYADLAGTGFRVPSYLGIPIVRNYNATAGKVTLVDRDAFKLFVGQSQDNSVGGIFNMVAVGALETKLRKRWHIYGNFATVLLDTQAATSITAVQ
jgi:hypothetical protein